MPSNAPPARSAGEIVRFRTQDQKEREEHESLLEELYGIDVSPDLISAVTDAVLDEVAEWQNRPLDICYLFEGACRRPFRQLFPGIAAGTPPRKGVPHRRNEYSKNQQPELARTIEHEIITFAARSEPRKRIAFATF